MTRPVRTRLVISFPGFEPVPVEAHRRRFEREGQKAAPLYGATLEVGMPEVTRGPVDVGVFDVKARGEGWATDSEVVFYGLASLNDMYDKRSLPARIATGIYGYFDYVLSGAFWRYGKVAWRYLLFCLYPIIVLGVALIAGGLVSAIAGWLAPSLLPAVLWAIFAAVALAVLIIGRRRLHLMLVLDDWTFSRDVVRGLNPDVEAKLRHVAEDARRRVAESDADEVLIVAHSFGAMIAVLTLADLLAREPAAKRVSLLTAGSSLLKFALHPAGERMRDAVRGIVENDIAWLDVQSRTDTLHCYGSDPARMFGRGATARQATAKVRFRAQLTPRTYAAIKYDFYRVHRQFVYGVERRSHYSFHMIACGPERFEDVVARGGLPANWQSAAREATS